MHDLRLVGVHEDGEHLLLQAPDGQRYRVVIDESMRAAVRRDRARLGQLQITMDGALRPKDIQARIRGGESAEDVAATSGLPVEHVRRYEGAVLSERAHVADRARQVPVRRRQGAAVPLDELVTQRLQARQAGSAREWDAWRAPDGSWTVQLAFRTGSKDRTACWRFDATTSGVEPVDDEARWLSSDSAGETGPVGGRRLAAVKERVYDVEADGGVREVPDESATEDGTASRDRRRTVDLLDTLRARRGTRQPVDEPDDDAPAAVVQPLDQPLLDQSVIDEVLHEAGLSGHRTDAAADLAEADLLTEAELDAAMADADLPPAAHPPASRPDLATDAHILELPGGPASDEEPADRPDDEPTDGPGGSDGTVRTGTRSRRGSRRATVPSWDDIVFGARRD